MEKNTISISPIPQNTTKQQIKKIFHAFSVKNVNLQPNFAYVEFTDPGDLEALQMQFQDCVIPELNNAKIDVAQGYDWNSFNQIQSKHSSNSSSDKHQDLTKADINNLIVIQNCDVNILNKMSIQNIRQIFHGYQSINRIIKKNDQVVIEFLDPNEIQHLQMKFDNYKVIELGKDSHIQRAEDANITPQQFTSEWSKVNLQESQITQATTQLGYQDQKTISGINKPSFGYDSQTNSQQVLHQQIIPPFDKKTSMEVNFLNQQSRLGYDTQKKQHEPIHEANTKQQLDYTSQINIQQNDDDRFGYLQEDKQAQAKKKMEQEKKKKQQQEAKRKQQQKKQQQQAKRKQEQQAKRKQQQQAKRRQQQQKKRKQEQQLRKKQQQQAKRRQQQQARKKRQEQQTIRKYQEQKRRKAQQQQKRKKMEEQQARKRRQSQLIDKELKEKLYAQREKFLKQEQERKENERRENQRKEKERIQQQIKNKQSQLGYPSESENVAKQTQFIKQAGQSLIHDLGYAVNMAKQQSINLINSGKQLIRNAAQKASQSSLGYENKQKPVIPKTQTENLGYKQWSVKPDINIPRSQSGTQKHISRTLITITLAVWVVFLLFQ